MSEHMVRLLGTVRELKSAHTIGSREALALARCYAWAEDLLDGLDPPMIGASSRRLLVFAEIATEFASEMLVTEIFGDALPVKFFYAASWPLPHEAKFGVDIASCVKPLRDCRISIGDIPGKWLARVWETMLQDKLPLFRDEEGSELNFAEVMQAVRDSGVAIRQLFPFRNSDAETERRRIERRRENARLSFIWSWEKQRLRIEEDTILNADELYSRAEREQSLYRAETQREILASLLSDHWYPNLTAEEAKRVLDELISDIAQDTRCVEKFLAEVNVDAQEERYFEYILDLLKSKRRWAEKFLCS